MDPTLLQVNAAQRRVQQMMSVAPQQFEELIVCHVSRRLELDGDKLDEFINGKGKSSGKRNSLKKIASPFQRKSNKQESEKENGLQVSSQIVNAISKLILSLHNAHDLREEGLFRKTGGITRQRELKQQILDDCSLCLNPYTTHDRASVIKHLLSDIPEPLLMTRHFEAFRQALGFKDNGIETAEQRCLRVFQLLMLHLPKYNMTVTRRLVCLLNAVAEEAANKMDAAALGTLFAPHLLCSREVQSNPVVFNCALHVAQETAIFIIKNGAKVFQIPAELDRDVTQFLKSEKRLSDESSSQSTPVRSSSESQPGMSPVATSLTFVPRSQDLQDTTKAELAKLQAHIQSLPELEKRKLKKQLNGSAALAEAVSTPSSSQDTPVKYEDTPRKHARSKSIGSSLRKRLPMFGSRSKRQPSCDSDPTGNSTLMAVNINFEETSTRRTTVINCHLEQSVKLGTDPSALTASPSYLSRRRRRRPHSDGDATPPKLECTDKENPNALLPGIPVKDAECSDSSLPFLENEIAVLKASNIQARPQLTLTPLNRQSPFPCLLNCDGQDTPQRHHFRFRETARPRSVACSPLSMETSL